ncbi:dual specificity protein kinase yak1 [Puccinia graminis f. sp. tritici]|uniref:Dual specificity protein kinase yak1 n=1 Tax=Puccinia graminis f. sp. tritici TaxID=56615 RepID=A0A5B0RI02_PUCGR|nr:dual specificity protein kinase yak1 [Puccinia graminis f. sp. tritici]
MNLPANNINNSNQQPTTTTTTQHQYYNQQHQYHQNLNRPHLTPHLSSTLNRTVLWIPIKLAEPQASTTPIATQNRSDRIQKTHPRLSPPLPNPTRHSCRAQGKPIRRYIHLAPQCSDHPSSGYLQTRQPSIPLRTQSEPKESTHQPSKPAGNNGLDNEDSDYILYVNDILGGSPSSTTTDPNQLQLLQQQQHQQQQQDPNHQIRSIRSSASHKYLILDVLGQGTFGQVVKCQDMKTHQVVAVKVVKNKQAYFSQRYLHHHNHLCLVFELLSSNLYELIKQNSFRGLSTSLVRVFTNQLLDALTVLNEAHLIHCDLKPENILLTSLSSPEIKVIDFGSACHERQTVYTYIQSRFYRSPEVILGLHSFTSSYTLLEDPRTE